MSEQFMRAMMQAMSDREDGPDTEIAIERKTPGGFTVKFICEDPTTVAGANDLLVRVAYERKIQADPKRVIRELEKDISEIQALLDYLKTIKTINDVMIFEEKDLTSLEQLTPNPQD